MARRKTRFGKKRRDLYNAHGQKVSGSTLIFNPSGVTMDKGGTDFGQGTNFAFYRGLTTLNAVSVGTQEITTGLSTVNSFIGTVQGSSTKIFCVVVNNSAGTVRCAFYRASGGSMANNVSGVSLHWLAIGTK